jgi:hypothetical protein
MSNRKLVKPVLLAVIFGISAPAMALDVTTQAMQQNTVPTPSNTALDHTPPGLIVTQAVMQNTAPSPSNKVVLRDIASGEFTTQAMMQGTVPLQGFAGGPNCACPDQAMPHKHRPLRSCVC